MNYLITDSGFEHLEIVGLVSGPEDPKPLLVEFETIYDYKPQNLMEIKDYFKAKIIMGEKKNLAKQKLVKDGYLEENEFFEVNDFLQAFINWLVKNKGFTKLDFEEIGYLNCV